METIEFIFKGMKITAYPKADPFLAKLEYKYNLYSEDILIAMAVRKDFLDLLINIGEN